MISAEANDKLLHLIPTGSWHQLASDDQTHIWITTASSLDIAQFEPTIHLPQIGPPAEMLRVLRDTDYAAFVVLDSLGRTVIAECRPRAGDRLYISRQKGSIEIANGLDCASSSIRTAPLSRRFLAVWLANALNFGGFDLFLGTSPFELCHLIARGLRAELSLDNNNCAISFLEEGSEACAPSTENLAEAIDNCRLAVTESVATATRESNVVAECSGGIDSGLTAVLASRVVKTHFSGAVFADYPYYEFRQERTYAQAIADHERFEILSSDPFLWIRWGALNSDCRSSVYLEPSLHIPYWGQALAGYGHISETLRPVILTGQGGDSLFQTRNLAPFFPPKPHWMPTEYWEMIVEETEFIRQWIESPNRASCGYGFDNPWMSRALGKIHTGAIYYSPLSSRASIKTFNHLRRILEPVLAGGTNALSNAQKPLAYAVFADYLPESVWVRRWKVNYVGLYYRSWLHLGKRFVDLVERTGPFLRSLGFVPRQIIHGVTEMAEGRKSSDRLLNAIITYLFWLDRFLASDPSR